MGGRTRRQSARDVGLGGGSVEDLGMNASTLERIRFAAANRLCVDVGYEGDVQRVEPYSLRKARGGNVVLYACEAGSSECATYRTGGISEVRSQGRRSFRSTPTSCCRRAARVERSGQPNKLAWRAWPPWRRPDSGVIDYRPIHISKMVLPTVNLGPPNLTVDRTGPWRAISSASLPGMGLSSGIGIVIPLSQTT